MKPKSADEKVMAKSGLTFSSEVMKPWRKTISSVIGPIIPTAKSAIKKLPDTTESALSERRLIIGKIIPRRLMATEVIKLSPIPQQ